MTNNQKTKTNLKLHIYMRVYRSIKDKIENETYPVGMLLPTETELQKEYGVSRATIRHTIALLQNDGLIRVKQGYGTEIIRKKVSQSMNSITSVSESLRKAGHDVGASKMYIERVYATPELAEELKLNIGDPLVLINRIQTSDGKPITIAKNYIPEKIVPGLLDHKDTIISLYSYIKEKYSIDITKVHDRISASAATFDEAIALDVEPKCALIVIKRICYTGSVPFEVDFVKIIASKYEYDNFFELEDKQ